MELWFSNNNFASQSFVLGLRQRIEMLVGLARTSVVEAVFRVMLTLNSACWELRNFWCTPSVGMTQGRSVCGLVHVARVWEPYDMCMI